jgi:predicted lipoprotein with Yx(FWY)xxD motif
MLVDGRGMTLYVYAPDKKNKSECYGECAEYWPPVTVAAGMKVPATMPGIKGTFGVTTRSNGRHQLTYDGAPLYTFVKDKKPGDMAGQGLDVAGGYWWVVVVSGAQARAASSGSGW